MPAGVHNIVSQTRVAFDIETVSPTVPADQYPEFNNPNHFEVQAGAIAIEENGEHVETVTHFRDGWGPNAEIDLIESLTEELLAASPDVTYTVNGEGFDFWLLRERAQILGDELDDIDLDETLSGIESEIAHEDLQPEIWSQWGKYTTLEEALDEAGINVEETTIGEFDLPVSPDEWRPQRGPPHVESSDVAILGETYLSAVDEGSLDEQTRELERMLDHYVRADVEKLFHLADARPF